MAILLQRQIRTNDLSERYCDEENGHFQRIAALQGAIFKPEIARSAASMLPADHVQHMLGFAASMTNMILKTTDRDKF